MKPMATEKRKPANGPAVVIVQDPDQIRTAVRTAKDLARRGYPVTLLAAPSVADGFAGQLQSCLENEHCSRLACRLLHDGKCRPGVEENGEAEWDDAARLLQSAAVVVPF